MKIKRALIIIGSFLLAVLAGCGQGKQDLTEQQEKPEGSPIVVGFSQVGAESEWRVANTESIKRALSEENGYELIFDDARNEQENQIRAIRTFIQQDVDYIVFSPRVETGWTSILQEARDAGIPVIVIETSRWRIAASIPPTSDRTFERKATPRSSGSKTCCKSVAGRNPPCGSYTFREPSVPPRRSAAPPRWKTRWSETRTGRS